MTRSKFRNPVENHSESMFFRTPFISCKQKMDLSAKYARQNIQMWVKINLIISNYNTRSSRKLMHLFEKINHIIVQLSSHRTKTMKMFKDTVYSKLQTSKWKKMQNNVDEKQTISRSIWAVLTIRPLLHRCSDLNTMKKNYGKFDENKDLNFTIVFYIWISSDHSAVHALGRLLVLAY